MIEIFRKDKAEAQKTGGLELKFYRRILLFLVVIMIIDLYLIFVNNRDSRIAADR